MMRSTFHANIPNMRGRRSYSFSCGCCDAYDKRDDYFRDEAEKEMRAAELVEREAMLAVQEGG